MLMAGRGPGLAPASGLLQPGRGAPLLALRAPLAPPLGKPSVAWSLGGVSRSALPFPGGVKFSLSAGSPSSFHSRPGLSFRLAFDNLKITAKDLPFHAECVHLDPWRGQRRAVSWDTCLHKARHLCFPTGRPLSLQPLRRAALDDSTWLRSRPVSITEL